MGRSSAVAPVTRLRGSVGLVLAASMAVTIASEVKVSSDKLGGIHHLEQPPASASVNASASSSTRRSLLPPIPRSAIIDQRRGELDISQGAELPQLLGGPAVPENNLVDLKSIEVPCPVPIDGRADMVGQLSQTPLVICPHPLLGNPTRRLSSHCPRLCATDCQRHER